MATRSKTSSVHSSTFLRGTHQLDIVGYNARKVLGGRNAVRSGDFQAGGCTWALVCSFQNSALSKRHLASIALHLVSSSNHNNVVATASLRIDDPTRRWPPAVWRSAEAKTFLTDDDDDDEDDSWELSIPDAFRESRHVKDDRLTIHCTVGVLREADDYDVAATTKNCSVSVVPPPSISRDLRKLLLLDDDDYSKSSEPDRSDICRTDVTFVVEGTEIHAHKLVLAMRSPVFAAELLGGMKEGAMCARVTIDDMTASTFKAMLHFIYTDELPSFINGAAPNHVAMAGDLLVAADRYDLERLRLMCEKTLAENMDAASAVTTLMLVHGRDNCWQLEASCIEYMASHPAAVAATEEYKDLKERCGSFVTDVLEKVWTRAPSSSSSSTASTLCQPQKTTSMFNPSKVFHGTHEFTIPNFCAVHRSLRAGEYIQSGTFQVGGYDWILSVYPSGYVDEGDEEQEYLSVFLTMAATNPEETTAGDVWVSMTYKMEDPSGESPPANGWAEGCYGKVKIAGLRNFMDLASTKSYYIGQNGALTIHCDVAITKEYSCTTTSTASATGATRRIDVPSSNIASHLEKLLASERGCDVKFLVQDTELRAHELVIAARSSAMREAVASAPDKNGIMIDDISVAVFKAVLHFIYTDELLLLPMGIGHARDATETARDLLVAADRFGLDRMKAMCENALCENVTTNNVVATLELADRLHWDGLKNFCLEHISQPHVLKEAMETKSFKDLKATSPGLLEEIMIKISKLLLIDL